MDFIKSVSIKQYKDRSYQDKEDKVIEEKNLNIIIGEKTYSVRLLPEFIEYFVYGYLFTNFFISCMDDVLEIKMKDYEARIRLREGLKTPDQFSLVSSCFSSGEAFEELSPIKDSYNPDTHVIIGNTAQFLKRGQYFEDTGCTHLAALFQEERFIVSFEDIGRHNSVDKIIGFILKNNIKPQGHMMLTTGRLSSEIVKKVVRAKIPLLVSRSAVTYSAINMAMLYNLKIIGFSRNKRFNIYT